MPKMSRRVLRIDPANAGPVWFAIITTGLVVLASFVLSFAALSTLASWMALPVFLGFLVPIFIDIAIVVFTYSAIAARAEGEPSWRPWLWVALWTTVSSAANGAHAWFYGPQGYEGIAGAVLAALIPIGSLLGTHEIADRIIIRPGRDVPTTAPVYTANPTRTRTPKTSKPNSQVSSSKTRQLTRRPSKAAQVSTAAAAQVDTSITAQVSTTDDPKVNTDGAQVDTDDTAQVDSAAGEHLETPAPDGAVQVDTVDVGQMDTLDRNAYILQLDSEQVPRAEIARRVRVSRTTVYSVLDGPKPTA